MAGRRARIESISSQNCRRDSGSTPVVGSSRTRRSGSCISAQHRLTFCFMPPESLPHGRLANGSRPYLPAVARRLHHSRELGEPFDFLTWFEYAPEHADAFEEMVRRLRSTAEWRYVEREVDIRASR